MAVARAAMAGAPTAASSTNNCSRRASIPRRASRSGNVGRPRPFVGQPDAVACGKRRAFRLGQACPVRDIVGEHGVESLASPCLVLGGGGKLGRDRVPLVLGDLLPIGERGDLAVGGLDARPVHGRSRLRSRSGRFSIATGGVVGGKVGGEAVASRTQPDGPGLPYRDGLLFGRAVAGGRQHRFARGVRRRGPLNRSDRLGASDLRGQPLGLGRVPGGLADETLQLAASGTFGLLGGPPFGRRRSLVGASVLQGVPRLGSRRCARRRSRRSPGDLGLEPLDRCGHPLELGTSLERAVTTAEPDRRGVEHRRAIPDDRQPADRQVRLDVECGVKRRQPDRPRQDRADHARAVASDRVAEKPPPDSAVRSTTWCRVPASTSICFASASDTTSVPRSVARPPTEDRSTT